MKNRIVAGVVVLLLTMGCVTNLPLQGGSCQGIFPFLVGKGKL